jgi:DUF4097 and DUF4098 domain-containing protein YvlB
MIAAALAVAPAAFAQSLGCDQGDCHGNVKSYKDGSVWVQELTGSLDAGHSLKISSDGGAIVVSGNSSQKNVTYAIRKRSYRSSSQEQAARDWNNFQVKVFRRGDTVYVEGNCREESRGCRVSADFNLVIPRDSTWVKAETKGGSVTITNLGGKVQVGDAGGSITLDRIEGPAVAATSGGSITVNNMGSDVKLETQGGGVNIGSVAGMVVANTSGGSIEVQNGGKDVALETLGGSIRVNQCKGALAASTAGGSIEVGTVGGKASLESAGGSIRMNAAQGAVIANTAAGGIRLWKLTHGVRAETSAGPIEAEFISNRADFTDSHLETVAGDIIVYLPSDLPVTIKAGIEMANGHKIRTDFNGLRISSEGGDYGGGEIFAEGDLNGGGPVLKVHTTNGNIEIRKTSTSSKRQ